MSAAARNSKWSNAAIVVETRPQDIPQHFVEQATKLGTPHLAGLLFRTDIEQKAKQAGKGQAAPAQLLTDFLTNKTTPTENLPQTSYTPGIVSSNLNDWMPPQITKRLAQGIKQIDKNMKGFIDEAALMIAPVNGITVGSYCAYWQMYKLVVYKSNYTLCLTCHCCMYCVVTMTLAVNRVAGSCNRCTYLVRRINIFKIDFDFLCLKIFFDF